MRKRLLNETRLFEGVSDLVLEWAKLHIEGVVLLPALLREEIDGARYDREDVVIEIKIADRCEREPLRIVEPTLALEADIREFGACEEVGRMAFLLAARRIAVVRNVFIFAELILDL